MAAVTQYQQVGVEQPDGLNIGLTAASLIGFHGAAPVAQQAHIADATDATTALTRINAILVVLENMGINATA
jgi:hypothetical protein